MNRASDFEWRYVERGEVKHALRHLPDIFGGELAMHALCGYWPNGPWLGTGNQDEYERAATLRYCSRCSDIGRIDHS